MASWRRRSSETVPLAFGSMEEVARSGFFFGTFVLLGRLGMGNFDRGPTDRRDGSAIDSETAKILVAKR